MIYNKRFKEYGILMIDCRENVMKEVNKFIQEKNIKRSDILELRTNEKRSFLGKCGFELIISWWE